MKEAKIRGRFSLDILFLKNILTTGYSFITLLRPVDLQINKAGKGSSLIMDIGFIKLNLERR